jgi:hypothetical protein
MQTDFDLSWLKVDVISVRGWKLEIIYCIAWKSLGASQLESTINFMLDT